VQTETPMTKEVADWLEKRELIGGKDAVKDGRSFWLMVDASAESRLDVMEWILSIQPEIFREKNAEGLTLFHQIAIQGHTDALKFLAGKGADINAENNSGYTPAGFAAQAGNIENVKCLAKLGADVSKREKRGLSLMDNAVLAGKTEVIKCLASLKVNVNDCGGNGWTSLHWAAVTGQTESIKCLIELGANIEARNTADDTPILMAAGKGQIQSIKCLVSLGADIKTEAGLILGLTAAEGQVESIKCLVSLGADVNAVVQNGNGKTAIFFAAGAGQISCMECLISLGAHITATDDDGQTAMAFAITFGEDGDDIAGAVRLLLAKGQNANAIAKNGRSALHQAARRGDVEIAKLLVSAGANANTKDNEDNEGKTPLDSANENGNTALAQYLMALE